MPPGLHRAELSAGVEIEDSRRAVGEDPNRISLRRYLDREDDFIALFKLLSRA